MIPNRRYEFCLFLLACVWAVFVSFAIQLKPGLSFVGDDPSYLLAAKRLYLEATLDDGRPLGIAAIFGLPFLFGASSKAAIVWGIGVNFCCWFVSVLLVFRILSGRIGKKKAFWVSAAFLSCIGNLAVAFNLLSEPVYIALILSAIYFLHRYQLENRTRFLSFALAILLFAALVKPVALGLAFLVAILHFRDLKPLVKHGSSISVCLSALLICIQLYGMKKKYGDYTISYIDTITYYNYLGGKADCLRKNIEFIPGENARAKYFNRFTSHGQKRLVKEDFKEQLTNNSGNLAKAYAYCLYSNSSKGSFIVSECANKNHTVYFDAFHFIFKAISKLQNIFLTISGVLFSFYCWLRWKKTSSFQRLLSAFVLYIFFVSAVSCFQCDRFHIVFFPLVFILLADFWANKKAGQSPA